MDVRLHLEDTQATLALGAELAKKLAKYANPPALLLQGDLGSGKTTLVRGLVESLPGADQAEVSSPSFNIFNLYPTVPPVAHFDLYRLEGMPPDDALFEHLDDPGTLTVVEWIQFLDRSEWPEKALFLEWTPSENGRDVTIHAFGETALHIARSLADHFTLK
ncbi:tRNA (adenosine(37)-N6)-threonylcarbamoyltransferase complex ATPase subunit type 1 TsaE [Pseudodesulfovibrio cashew]|uniref:tRNA threonylcarbamoyladenosine biosynthesis protein TsaE n=1 Tax=Pseudodesulfovibrio cashew TaxID=2678688 RepID=A0A6I6JJQ7_9BACT|nr:tRNA (adenosine(37)-N6)-threonylcarbamoyltransferase complex ATPase subunit type 1 TsaE [Pseudodesulfovibrio cashew]QGY41260.1 tRNA (adenosine(37)-N6)-threonylcarbamoyltransferase complex ATPase subunit type 1 TsaE [Pseudodesulfovibrio cashew]